MLVIFCVYKYSSLSATTMSEYLCLLSCVVHKCNCHVWIPLSCRVWYIKCNCHVRIALSCRVWYISATATTEYLYLFVCGTLSATATSEYLSLVVCGTLSATATSEYLCLLSFVLHYVQLPRLIASVSCRVTSHSWWDLIFRGTRNTVVGWYGYGRGRGP